jgi:hypothetical protein
MATDHLRASSRSGLSVGTVSAVAIVVAALVNYRVILQGFSPVVDFRSGLDRSRTRQSGGTGLALGVRHSPGLGGSRLDRRAAERSILEEDPSDRSPRGESVRRKSPGA